MGNAIHDLRYGLRLLHKSPGFTAVAVLTMALGIAANTAVFSWIRAVLLNPFPGAGDPGRIVSLETVTPSGEHVTTSFPDYLNFVDYLKLFDGLAVAQPRSLNLGEGTRAERVWAEIVSGNFFDVLKVKPAAGRFFEGDEQGRTQGAHPVVVISHALWKSRFHSDPAAVGATIRINRIPFTIIGVAPAQFRGSMAGLSFGMWAPATMYGQLTGLGSWPVEDRKTRMFLSFARLKPGVSIEQGRAELRSLGLRMAEANGYTNSGINFTLEPMWNSSFGVQRILAAPLAILMGVCGVVLLLVCANVANLLLARASARDKEFAIRLALGAPRGRIVRQLLMEALLVAFGGALAGLLLTDWMHGSIRWLLPAASIPGVAETPLDSGILFFTAAVSVFAAVAAGLAPALHASKPVIHETLKEGGRGASAGVRANRLRGVLVASEVALAVIALVGAGLFVKSFATTRTINPGFDPSHVVIAQFHVTTAGYDATQTDAFCRRLRERLESAPGVTAVSYADTVPLGFDPGAWEDLDIEGYVPSKSENMKIYRNLVAPGYFDLMKIPLLDGRDFTGHDDINSLPVMIVNQEFVRRFVPGGNPIGRKVRGWGKPFTIVGIAKNSKYHSLAESPMPYFYIPIRQIFRPEFPLTFHVRTAAAPEAAIRVIRAAAQAIDPDVALFDATPLADYMGASLFGQKVAASMLSVLGAVALLLAAVGLYSVMAYSIVQRTHEIGIRVALGAQPRDVLRLMVGQGMALAGAGLLAGSLAAAALSRFASAALIGVSPADPAVYGAVALFLALVSLLATYIPARRAMRVDPMISLRYQ